MKYDIESKLNTVKTKPMTGVEKNTMWQKIEMGMNKKTAFAFGVIRTRIRAAVALVLAVLLAGSGVAFAYADTAVPGDILFPLGVAREKVEIFLAPATKKNDLRVKFAEKRIEDGQVFLSLLVRAKGTYASTTAFASSTATTTVTTAATAIIATTTSNSATANVTADAARHFNATIAYLQGIQAELLKNGDTRASSALQNAIDAMIAQAHQTPPLSGDDSVLVKIKNNTNRFKLDLQIANGTTTTRIAVTEKPEKNKKHDRDDDRWQNGTTTALVNETFFSNIFHKKEKHENRDDDDEDGDDHESFFERFGKKAIICHISDGRTKTISIRESAVKAHLEHGDSLGRCDTGGTATTTPDTTMPAISDLSAALITANSATVYWNTNESSTGKVTYGTTTPLINIFENITLSLTHSFNLTGLVASTTYRYTVSSTDSAGNATTSVELTFTTL